MAVKRSRTLCTAFLREVRVYITPPKAALEIRIKQGFFNPKCTSCAIAYRRTVFTEKLQKYSNALANV